VLLDSEADAIAQACAERRGQASLRLAPALGLPEADRCLDLYLDGGHFEGAVRCGLPLPLASESLGTVVLQHVADYPIDRAALLGECARVLVPGGRLWLFALNPLAPYRWRWARTGLRGAEPVIWRRRLRAAGLTPDAVSQGLGPRWRIAPDARAQHGAGLRAAYLLRAEKRIAPLTPVRVRPQVRLQTGVPAA
jgi:SAM-dependent methyltransferase